MYCNSSYLNMTLVAITLGNYLYPNLTFSTTIRVGIISLLYQNLTANAVI